MDKRLIIFVTISLVIIFLYPFFINKMMGPPQKVPSALPEEKLIQEQPTDLPVENKEVVSGEPETTEEVGSPELSETPLAVPLAEEEGGDTAEIEKRIESDLYRVVISNIGGVIKSWELKKYTKKNGEGEEDVPIQLVPENTSHFPLTLNMEGNSNVNTTVYSIDATPVQLSSAVPDGLVRLVSVDESGRTIKKEIHFYNDKYLVNLKVETKGYDRPYDLSLGTNFGINEWDKQGGRGGSIGAVALIDGEVVRDAPGKMEDKEVVHEGRPKWFGLQNKYFISSLIPLGDESIGPITVYKEGDQGVSAKIRVGKIDQNNVRHFSLYAGPKEYDRLTAVKVNLDESIDFGWFISGSWLPVRLISKPIFYLLRFFYQFTQNYGVAIIIVTVLIKALFFPITRKSLKSMKAMSSLTPKINELKKKWAGDKEKMNRELMNLYKKEKVNPLGGCLPMILQIPVFISLFNILYTTIDLRRAPFFLWVQDLSEPDPFYVLPIVMGATMFIQQKTQPTSLEPTQAKVMQYLPVVYTFFFLNFPSGLVLYWLVNNILTIIQQHFIKKDD